MNPLTAATPPADPRAVYAERQAAWVSSTHGVMRGQFVEWRTDWCLSAAMEADEQGRVDQLMDLTAVFGPWEAARLLFTPNHGRT